MWDYGSAFGCEFLLPAVCEGEGEAGDVGVRLGYGSLLIEDGIDSCA